MEGRNEWVPSCGKFEMLFSGSLGDWYSLSLHLSPFSTVELQPQRQLKSFPPLRLQPNILCFLSHPPSQFNCFCSQEINLITKVTHRSLLHDTCSCCINILHQNQGKICSAVSYSTETSWLALQPQITHKALSAPSLFFPFCRKHCTHKFYFYRECCTPQKCNACSYFSVTNWGNWKLLNAQSSYIKQLLSAFSFLSLAPVACRYTVKCSCFPCLSLLHSSILSLWNRF